MHYIVCEQEPKEAKMSFRFRKSVNFGIFRVNASKSGLGWSVGVPGARYTKMANGRTRTTASIPGTGISWVEESKKRPVVAQKEEEKSGWEIFFDVLLAVFAVAGIILFAVLSAAAKGSKKW